MGSITVSLHQPAVNTAIYQVSFLSFVIEKSLLALANHYSNPEKSKCEGMVPGPYYINIVYLLSSICLRLTMSSCSRKVTAPVKQVFVLLVPSTLVSVMVVHSKKGEEFIRTWKALTWCGSRKLIWA